MNLSRLDAYEVIEERRIDDLNSDGAVLRHKKTGARITLLHNTDENKVFYIGFRTPPTDSTGVAHIIEHSVLCGSDKYPVKDPFVELAKGSLNTFLNAITYPDKTVYPVASCNDKDFANLMDVYLDAVFHPAIYRQEKIFRQEGWHYECEDEQSDITYNGVVYNEMKGAYSSADDLLEREVLNGLYPDTAYGVDSGGAPESIPSLTYEEFLAFHQKYYHPSNSYIYLYGDMDMEERLTYLDREYLSKYEFLDVSSEIGLQKPFAQPAYLQKEYPVLASEEEEAQAYFSYSVSIGTSLDKELYLALQVLDYALCSAPGAPVRTALLNKGIGQDVYSVCENGIYQPYFSFIAKNAKPEDADEFVRTVEETLAELVSRKIPESALYAAINLYEFRYKEADFGSYPKGLMYGLQAFDSWLYDSRQPFLHIEANATFAALKEKVGTDYYEKLVKEQILDNPHKLILTMLPSPGLEEKKEKELAGKLKDFKHSLTKEQLADIVRETKALKAYQEEETPPEDLAKIPVLSRGDLKKEARAYRNEMKKLHGAELLFHDIYTNGVSYIRLAFDVRDLDAQLLPYLSLLKNMLGLVDTEHYSYGELFHEMNLKTGGISFQAATYTNASHTDTFRMNFEVTVKTLYENTQQAMELLTEILFTSKLRDEKRLKEILGELKSRMQARMTNAGHLLAVTEAVSYFSLPGWTDEQMSGVTFYRFVSELLSDFDNRKEACFDKLEQVLDFVLAKNRVMYDYTGTQEGLALFEQETEQLHGKLAKDRTIGQPFTADLTRRNEGFVTSAGVQYVCVAGDFSKKGLVYNGALRVLRVMMGYDYLWTQVRVKGGAYGCMSNFARTGISYFVSYRDPNLKETFEVYKNAPAYLRSFTADEDVMTKYIIGAIAEKDMPLTPSQEGTRSFNAYMANYSQEREQKERDEILTCTEKEIHDLADYVQAMLDENAFCVVGGDSAVRENEDLFGQIKPLF